MAKDFVTDSIYRRGVSSHAMFQTGEGCPVHSPNPKGVSDYASGSSEKGRTHWHGETSGSILFVGV
jgi:hypothetical protein